MCILCMSTERVPSCTLSTDAGNGWKMRHSDRSVQWQKGEKTSTHGPIRVGTVRLLSWGPRDPSRPSKKK